MLLGAHVSVAGGVQNAPGQAAELGISCFQIFTKNQNRWEAPKPALSQIEEYLANCGKYGIQRVVAHGSYLINLCAQDPVKLERSRNALADEVQRADELQVLYLVVHPGSHLGVGEELGIEQIAASLNEVNNRHPEAQVQILLENTAGQGRNLGYTFEQLRDIINQTKSQARPGICLDTCHLFAAGFDFRSQSKYHELMQQVDEIIGMDKVKVVHLNDSQRALGSRVDRHANIGQGLIGSEPFGYLLNDPRLKNVLGILETPGGLEAYRNDLAILSELHHSPGQTL